MKYSVDEIAQYMVWLISDFAHSFNLTTVEALKYLDKYNGLRFIEDYYDVLHTYSFDEAVEDITKYCHRQGGYLI